MRPFTRLAPTSTLAPFFALGLALATTATTTSASAKPPGEWTCVEAYYDDETCDCGCGAPDPDCTMSTFEGCMRSGCGTGKVPWEHAPESCMTSACGDGWKDEAMGEACDDGDAIASGGCSADCKTVSPGYTCGERADKCALNPTEQDPTPEATEPTPEATEPSPEPTTPNPESDDGKAEGGGCAGGTLPAWGALLVLAVLRRP